MGRTYEEAVFTASGYDMVADVSPLLREAADWIESNLTCEDRIDSIDVRTYLDEHIEVRVLHFRHPRHNVTDMRTASNE